MRLQWMNEFSDVGSVLSDINTLHLSKAVSSHLEYKSSSGAVNSLEPEADNLVEQKEDKKNPDSADHKRPRRKTTINFLFDLIQKHGQHFEGIGDIKFDLFKLCETVGREQLLPIMMLTTMYNMGLKQLVNENKVALFLDRVVTTYRQDV